MSDKARALEALHSLDPGMPIDHWHTAGRAAIAAGLTLDDIDAWSSGGHNYQGRQDIEQQFRNIKPEGGTTERTLYKMALDAGWNGARRPRSHYPSSPQPPVKHKSRRQDVEAIWNQCAPDATNHPYIRRKLGMPDGLRVYRGSLTIAGQPCDGALVLPVFTLAGDLASLQFVLPEGKKVFLPDVQLPSDGCLVIGGPIGKKRVYVLEGIGQGWSAHQSTRYPVVVCFGWGRVAKVVEALRAKYPNLQIIIVPDAGKEAQAAAIAQKVQGEWVEMPAGSAKNFDLNDLHLAEGIDAVANLLAQAKEPAPPAVWPSMSGNIAAYLDAPAPPVHWFAHERLLANRAHLLTGVGGCSKTTVLYHLGIGAVVGRLPWNWDIKRTGSAILILAEDDPDNVHRVIANHVAHGTYSAAERRLIGERLRIFPLAGQPCRLLASGPGGTLVETEAAKGLFQLVKQQPDLVFIGLDPALALTDGDELSPAHQRRLGEFADRLALEANACTVVVSHAAKAVANASEMGSHTSRGSGAITDAVRGEFTLRTMTAAEAKRFGIDDLAERRAHVQLVMTKSNAAPPSAFSPLWLKRGIGGLLNAAQLVEEEPGTVGTRQHDALEILRKLAKQSSPTMNDWRTACVDAGLITGSTHSAQVKAMDRIRDALLKAKLVERGMTKGIYLPVVDAEDEA